MRPRKARQKYGIRWRRQGGIGPFDVLIAGHALAEGLVLVTNNTGEFSRVDGLTLEDWHRSL